MEAILTAGQAKEARSKTRLSQGKVATELGINRAYLSLFEGGKYVLEDSVLKELRGYYERHGFTFDEDNTLKQTAPAPRPERTPVRLMDGFQVIDAMPDEEAEALLAEHTQNRAKIRELCAQKPKEGGFAMFFSDIDEEDLRVRLNEILMLMARNFTLVEQLQGRETVLPRLAAQAKAPRDTVGDCLSALFAETFGFKGQDAPITEEDEIL